MAAATAGATINFLSSPLYWVSQSRDPVTAVYTGRIHQTSDPGLSASDPANSAIEKNCPLRSTINSPTNSTLTL